MKNVAYKTVLILLIPLLLIAQKNNDDIHWSPEFAFNNFVGGEVSVFASEGDDIYLSRGSFIIRYTQSAGHWYVLAYTNGTASDMEIQDGKLYVCGNFTELNGSVYNGIAILEGDTFAPLPPISGTIENLTLSPGGNLYVSGINLNTTGSGDSTDFAVFKEGEWSLINTVLDGEFKDIHFANDLLYVAGDFSAPTGQLYRNIAAVDPETGFVDNLQGGTDGIVLAVETDNEGNLYIGGGFSEVGGVDAQKLAKYNGQEWESIGEIGSGLVYKLKIIGDRLYTGGSFKNVDGTPTDKLAYLENGEWLPMPFEFSGQDFNIVQNLGESNGNLIIAGIFQFAGNYFANGFAIWKGSEFEYLFPDGDNGISSITYSITNLDDESLYAGGAFNTMGKISSPGLAYWTGDEWKDCAGGIDPPAIVYSTDKGQGKIYFTGWFLFANGKSLNNVAGWDPLTNDYIRLGDGIDGGDGTLGPIKYTEKFGESILYAGGGFRESGGKTMNYVTQWDGESWKPMGKGVYSRPGGFSRVYELEADEIGMLYVGGDFDSVSAGESVNCAVWNPFVGDWFSLGKFLNGSVSAIHGDGEYAYFGGRFTKAGNIDVSNIARLNWQTFEWEAIGDGTNGPVYSILKNGDDVYIGGAFSLAGSTPANSIVKWNEFTKEFTPLGNGLTYGNLAGGVYDMELFRGKLYVAGFFTNAGDKMSMNIASWDDIIVNDMDKVSDDDNNITIYPVPATEIIAVNSNNGLIKKVVIANLTGEELIIVSSPTYINGININISSLAPGYYNCIIFSNNGLYNKPLLIVR